jgi:hypothetical protein
MSPGLPRSREPTITQSTNDVDVEAMLPAVDISAAPKLAKSSSGLTAKQRCMQAMKNLEYKLRYMSRKEVCFHLSIVSIPH